jgi:hypothetical protein
VRNSWDLDRRLADLDQERKRPAGADLPHLACSLHSITSAACRVRFCTTTCTRLCRARRLWTRTAPIQPNFPGLRASSWFSAAAV